MSQIIIVSDDLQVASSLTKLLTKASHQVVCLDNTESVFSHLQTGEAELVLIDDCLTNKETLPFIKLLRKRYSTPILLLINEPESILGLKAIQAGADQCLTQPFSNKALLIYVEALLRRVSLEKKRLSFEHCSEQFSVKISRLPFTETEAELVQYLSQNNGDIISKARLQKEVLKKELSTFDRNLDMHISNIRRKMSNAGLAKSHIKTVHGKGYTFSEQIKNFSIILLCLI